MTHMFVTAYTTSERPCCAEVQRNCNMQLEQGLTLEEVEYKCER